MYTSIRRYTLVEGVDVQSLIKHINDMFIPALRATPGFKGYYVIDTGDGVVATVSVFENETGVDESNRLAARYVKDNVAELVHGAPQITQGYVLVRVE